MTRGKRTGESAGGAGRDRRSSGRDAAAAVGALLGFYRRVDGRSQKELSAAAALYPSETAMFESGRRLPSAEAIRGIAKALGLDQFQQRQLEVIAGSLSRAAEPGHEWWVPADVLHGAPFFLRRLDAEAELQKASDISVMWIVTHKPLALEGAMYQALLKKLSTEGARYVYFIGGAAAKESFEALWGRVCNESAKLRSVIEQRLECILAPASLSLYHFGICNPGQQSRMFGRAIMYHNGLPVGFYPMDAQQVSRAYQLLHPAYQLCRSKKGQKVVTDYGAFQLIVPGAHP